jgi:hypothetical protein
MATKNIAEEEAAEILTASPGSSTRCRSMLYVSYDHICLSPFLSIRGVFLHGMGLKMYIRLSHCRVAGLTIFFFYVVDIHGFNIMASLTLCILFFRTPNSNRFWACRFIDMRKCRCAQRGPRKCLSVAFRHGINYQPM